MIYLDNAATSWPKPPEVAAAMTAFLTEAGGNPGRAGHRLSIAAGRIVYEAREALAELFHVGDPLRVILTANATHAINLVLHGLLRPGDRVVTSGVEHNAVMRPLRALERTGVQVDVVPCASDGSLSLAELREALSFPARLLALTHASNVTGTLLPVQEAAALGRRAGARVLVDAAQTAGCVPIAVDAMGIDYLAFTGHKALYGPPGTGGLVLGSAADPSELVPLQQGGTGSRSESEEQPDLLPDKFESGTPNGVGIAGLAAGVRVVLARGVPAIQQDEAWLCQALLDGLASIPGVRVHGPKDAENRVAVVSFTADGCSVSDLGFRLDEEHGILTRVGLHCAPAAHRAIGTFPHGTVRLAPGAFTTLDEVRTTVAAIGVVVAR